MPTTNSKLAQLDLQLENIEKEREILDNAEKILVDGGLKMEYLELRKEAKDHLQEAKRLIQKIEALAPEIMRVPGWRHFFKSYEAVIIKYAKEEWTARNILFLSGEESSVTD